MCSYLTSLPWLRSGRTPCGDGVVVGEHRAGVAVGAEVLARVEAGGRGGAERCPAGAVRRGALGLGGVLDTSDVRGAATACERLHRGDLAEEVHAA